SCTLNGSGQCSVTYTPSAGSEGTHTITGAYNGDTDHTTSNGTFDVAATQRSTTTSVSCSPASTPVNAATSCTVTVTDAGAGTPITPSGTVGFTSNAAGAFDATSCTLDGLGQCSVSYTPDPGSEGTHTVAATYSGDTDHGTSSASTDVDATQRSTTTSVACSPDPDPVNAL